jgi:hypothetical protein
MLAAILLTKLRGARRWDSFITLFMKPEMT